MFRKPRRSGSPGSLIIVLDLLDDRDRLLDGFDRVGLLHDARLFSEQLADFDAAGVESLPVVDQPAGLAHRAVDHPQEGVETHQIAEGHVALDDQKAAEAEVMSCSEKPRPSSHGMYLREL